MDIGGCANGDFTPVHLNTASREALLSIGWISVRDVDEILQCRGPQGQLYQSQMARLTSLDEERLGDLVRRGIVTVQLDEDANDMGDTHSVTSVTSSMLEELEAIREENRLLREAMENQSRAQQEIMTRVVSEMATHDRTGLVLTGDQFMERARQMTATDDRLGGQPSHGVSDLPGPHESLASGSMGQPTLTGNASRSTNPFVTPRHSQEPVRESVSETTGRTQYFAGGDLLDSRYEPWDSWTRRVHGYVSVEQPQPQPWVKDIVSGECHQDLRDHPGYGRWGRCVSGYRADESDESVVRGGHRGMQIHDEGVSSDESGSLSRQSRGSSQRSRASRVIQRTPRDSSWWRERSSSANRSPSADRSDRRRHQSPPLPKPPVFSGKEGEWNSFIFQFRKIAHYYGWDQQEKVGRLLVSLRGKAIDFIRNKSREVQDDYRTLRDALELRFGQREHPTSARRELNCLQQHEEESLEDFADIVLAKVSEAYPRIGQKLGQDIAKEIFLRGCRNRNAAYAAAEKDPSTPQDALEKVRTSAMNWKVFGKGNVSTRRVRFMGQEDGDGDAYSASDEEMRLKRLVANLVEECGKERRNAGRAGSSRVKCYKCGGYGHMARECCKEVQCFRCGEAGHMRSECPQQEEQAGSQARKSESAPKVWLVHVNNPKAAASVSVASSGDNQPQVRQFHWMPNQALSMEVPVSIGRRKMMTVIDTAAQVTIINRSLSVELGYEAPVERVELRNAQTDSWMGGGMVEGFGFRLGSEKYSWDVIEADIEDAFILWMDFLKSTRCKIDLGNDILELGSGHQVPATVRRHTSNEAVKVSQFVSSSECAGKLVSNNLDRRMCEGFRTVVSIEATTLPGVSLQDVAQLDSVRPASLGDAHFQGIVQSCASAQDCTRTGSEASTATLGQVGQKEAGMRSASKPGVTQILAGSKQWRPQEKDSRSRSPDVQTTPLRVQDEPELRGQRSAVHDFGRPRSLLHLQSVRKRRNQSGFWSPRPQLEEWESWRHRARGPAHAKD